VNTNRRAVVVLGLLLWLMAVGTAQAGEIISVADFARSPVIDGAKLAPDGKYLGYLYNHEGRREVSFLELATGKARYYNPGRSLIGPNTQMAAFDWVSNERVIIKTMAWGKWSTGLGAVNRDLSGWTGLTGVLRLESFKSESSAPLADKIIYSSGQDAKNVLLLEHGLYPDVLSIDSISGRYSYILKNPGNVISWLADWMGDVRFGLRWDGKHSHLIYRRTPMADWQMASDQGDPALERSFVGLDPSGRVIHVAQAGRKGRWAIFPLVLENNQMGAAIIDHDEYDILPPDYRPHYAGTPLAAAVYAPKSHALIGVHYVTEGPRQVWFDPVMGDVQRQLDALHPGLSNKIVSMDHEGSRLLVLSWSARDPGFYSLVDLSGQKINVIGRRMPWIKPEQMAEMYPITCQARDGLPLHGYLTLLQGEAKKNLPLVMLVHGGPWVRDVWGFDPLVQFLANRGYAVLQINYRGSIGYGQDFAAKGQQEIGGAIQDDIADAVQWSIEQGFADPRRIAIMGASYGGFSTLFALAKSPGLYRCGIDIAGATDWPELLTRRDMKKSPLSTAYWEERIGSLKDEKVRQRLAEISPVNYAAQIKSPLLIIHGKDDQVVPLSQSKKLVALLEKQGAKPTTVYLSGLGHSFPQDKLGIEFLTAVENFLSTNLRP